VTSTQVGDVKIMEDVGIWIRVSSLAQDEKNQVPDIEGHCQGKGYRIARRYELNDKSAFHGEQEARQQEALDDMRAGRIRVLVVWASDRLERRGAEATLKVFRLFREAGGQVESVLEPYLNDADSGELLTAITGWKDRAESARKSERTRINNDGMRARGALIGLPPWGFAVAGERHAKTMVPTADGRTYIPEIYSRVVRGDSLATVAKWLASETGRTWWPKTIGNLIKNPAYMGRRCEWFPETRTYGRVLLRCEALVDAGVWRKANEALATRPHRGPLNVSNGALLAGVLRCPRCGNSPMYRTTAGTTVKHYYYRCSGRGAARRGCGNLVPVDVADARVDAYMAKSTNLITVTRVVPGHNYEAELEDIEMDLRRLAAQGLDEDKEDAERARLRAERKRLAALPSVPDELVTEPGDETYAERWARLGVPERNAWMREAGIRLFAMKGNDAEVLAVAEKKLAALFWEQDEDGQVIQHTEIPPSIDGVWIYVESLARKIKKVALVRPRS
jgi:DNA invertase Pin-like site-specific DNA recombinase